MLIFDRERHEYFLDDVLVPSVTQVLPAKQFYISPGHLERLRQEGEDNHDLIRMHFDTRTASEHPILIALEQWLGEHPETGRIVQHERPLGSRKHLYAGTPDLICEKAIIEFKRSKPEYRFTPLQLAGYYLLAIENKIIKRTRQWLVLWYDGRKFNSKDVFNEDAPAVFRACVRKYYDEQTIRSWMKGKKESNHV